MQPNNENKASWLAHLDAANPRLSPELERRVAAYRAAMGGEVGSRLLVDLGLRPIPRRTTKSGPKAIERACGKMLQRRPERPRAPEPSEPSAPSAHPAGVNNTQRDFGASGMQNNNSGIFLGGNLAAPQRQHRSRNR